MGMVVHGFIEWFLEHMVSFVENIQYVKSWAKLRELYVLRMINLTLDAIGFSWFSVKPIMLFLNFHYITPLFRDNTGKVPALH